MIFERQGASGSTTHSRKLHWGSKVKVANIVFIAGGTLLSISIGLMAATTLLASAVATLQQ